MTLYKRRNPCSVRARSRHGSRSLSKSEHQLLEYCTLFNDLRDVDVGYINIAVRQAIFLTGRIRIYLDPMLMSEIYNEETTRSTHNCRTILHNGNST